MSAARSGLASCTLCRVHHFWACIVSAEQPDKFPFPEVHRQCSRKPPPGTITVETEGGGVQRGGDDSCELKWRHCSDAVEGAFKQISDISVKATLSIHSKQSSHYVGIVTYKEGT